MKKLFILLAAALLCLTFVSCGRTATGPAGEKPTVPGDDKTKISYYFKPKENAFYIYKGSDDSYTNWMYFYDYIGDDKVQRRVISTNIVCTEVWSFSDGEMILTNGLEHVYDHLDNRYEPDNSDVIFLKEPLTLGTSWVRSKDGNFPFETKITGVDVEVTVPYGTFKALEVTTVYTEGVESEINYYAKDIGLIKTVSLLNGNETVSELSEIREEQAMSEKAFMFYLNDAKDGIEYDVTGIIYRTNANLPELYAQAARRFMSSNLGVELDENIKINSISLNVDASSVTVDFNDYALNELEKITDTKTQELILQCAANYFGYLYKTKTVEITVGGSSYKSVAVDIESAVLAE